MEEIFKNITELDGLYKIGNLGKLFDVNKKKIVTNLQKSPYGYWYYQLWHKGKHVNIYLHKEVAKAFPEICGKYKAGYIAHHKNGNKEDNRAINLILVTKKEHMKIHCAEDPERLKYLCHGFHRHHSEETKKLFSLTRKGQNKGADNYASIPVLMIDKKTGSVIGEFESIHIAGEYLGDVRKQANIWKCLVGKLKSAYGYKWKYKKAG